MGVLGAVQQALVLRGAAGQVLGRRAGVVGGVVSSRAEGEVREAVVVAGAEARRAPLAQLWYPRRGRAQVQGLRALQGPGQ